MWYTGFAIEEIEKDKRLTNVKASVLMTAEIMSEYEQVPGSLWLDGFGKYSPKESY